MLGSWWKWGSATRSMPPHGILTRKRCCPQPCPYTPLYGGSVSSCKVRFPIPYIHPLAAAFTRAAHRPCPSARRLSRHGKPSSRGTIRRATCTPEHRMTYPAKLAGVLRTAIGPASLAGGQHLAEMRNNFLGKEL